MPIDYILNKEFLPVYGDNIRRIRTNRNLSQSQLAFEVGTTIRQIQRIEKGEINAGILYYRSIAEILEGELIEIIRSK